MQVIVSSSRDVYPLEAHCSPSSCACGFGLQEVLSCERERNELLATWGAMKMSYSSGVQEKTWLWFSSLRIDPCRWVQVHYTCLAVNLQFFFDWQVVSSSIQVGIFDLHSLKAELSRRARTSLTCCSSQAGSQLWDQPLHMRKRSFASIDQLAPPHPAAIRTHLPGAKILGPDSKYLRPI